MSAKISVGSSAFAIGAYKDDPIPLDKVITRLSEIGYDGIELFGDKPYGHPDDYPSKADRKALRSRLADHNLEVSNYGADFWGIPLGSSDADARKYEDAFKRNLEFCVDIGSDSIRVDTVVGKFPDGDQAAVWRRYVSTWRNASRAAARANVEIYWEFEPGFIINKPSEIARLTDEIGEPNFKLMFDTCHAQMSGVQGARQSGKKEAIANVAALVRAFGSRIGTVHLIDSDNTLHHEETSTHAPFGTGVLNFDAIVTALQEVGYRGQWWTIDLCFWPTAWDIVGESHHFVNDLLKRHHLR
jgi:sugar phosphate isomerase/epimerase